MTTKDKLNALIEAGKTQKWIADSVGVRQPTISRIITGKHKRVYSDIADSVSDLYTREVVASQRASNG